MLDGKVYDICAAYTYRKCHECPLHGVCAADHEDIPGDTIESKTVAWEARMNEAARDIDLHCINQSPVMDSASKETRQEVTP